MSKGVSALDGASYDKGIAHIQEVPLQGMITLRGDLGSKTIKKAATGAASVDMPDQGRINSADQNSLCWMSSDELLVLCPYDDVLATLEKMQTVLAGEHALAVDVSDARAQFSVSGPQARTVMSKLAPVDFAPDHFKPGMFRRSRMAQVAAAFWMPEEDRFNVICFRSNAEYVFTLLSNASQVGSEINTNAF
ncbi:MAG: sarcosine oxidase subunit gamma family protein [Paracoccaceae bacterium]